MSEHHNPASFTFSSQRTFQKTLATQQAKVNNALAAGRRKVFEAEKARRVKPSFQEMTGGRQFQVTFHHGRKYDREDLHAQDARKESERSKVLEKQSKEREWRDRALKGKGDSAVFEDVGEGFISHFPKAPDQNDMARQVAKDQAGLWSENKSTEISRVEKVIAKKWGVDCDAEYWSDGTQKKGFLVTFFHGRRFDRDDYQQQDKLAEGNVKRKLLKEEMERRKKYANGEFPHEIAMRLEMERHAKKPSLLLNFPKLDKKECIGTGEEIPMLEAIDESALKPKTRWSAPECTDFEYAPSRPGVSKLLKEQKEKIRGKQRLYKERKRREGERWRLEEEERAFGVTSWEGHEDAGDADINVESVPPSSQYTISSTVESPPKHSVNFNDSSNVVRSHPSNNRKKSATVGAEKGHSGIEEEDSFVSAHTSITIMKSEMSMDVPNTPKNGFANETNGL